MHIAQLSVAGEAVLRPQISPDRPEQGDQKALDEYACDRSNLPWIIFRAAHRANHLSALPARARAVLAALARTVDAGRPFAAIFARRELLTGRALQSMRTFYRSLDDLESSGFITRPPQSRYGGGGLFGRAYLHLTHKAAALLGLVEIQSEPEETYPPTQEDAVQPAPAVILSTPSVSVADGAIYKDLIPSTQKRQPRRLPPDLERLGKLGFRDFLVFKLMREARSHGKRLSDVVEATWDHLRQAKRPISYLRTLLRAPVDFAHRVRSKRQEAVERATVCAVQAQTEREIHALAGRAFVSHDHLRQYVVADDARSVTVKHRDEARPRVHAGAWATDFLAALRTGRIVVREAGETSHFRAPPTISTPDRAAAQSNPKNNASRNLDALRHFLRLKRAGVVTTSVTAVGERYAARRAMQRANNTQSPVGTTGK
ncbi:replication protein O [Caballeronia sp. LZ019]|uniref:replication protein O n=1 Tax=Caballeronia sp. LZ019 TaxID=3038555 RepID=UPI00285FDDE8|nr:replication protein O [Caballeronia sp. LZ019]MDR5808598.1 replication protein O [Caballeronia sp. LZ019]